MATSTMPPQVAHQLGATRTHGVRIALIVGGLLLLGLVACLWLFLGAAKGKTKEAALATLARPWVSTDGYSVPEKPAAVAQAAPVDRTAEQLAQMRNELLALKLKLDEVDKRKTTTGGQQKAQSQAATTAKAPEKRPAPMLYVHKDLKDTLPTDAPKVLEYVLAPWATYLPCLIQPLMNSDVPGAFTAKVSQNVYDTKTGQHLLVPQGATLGGSDHGETLLYGNERLPTVAVALTIQDRTYDLGQVPVTDHLGTNGLTGRVNQHWARLFGAVFISGALKGGQQMLQMEIAQAGGAGQVAAGIAATGNQAGQQRIGRALDTRPTIEVFPGQQCNVLLTKELRLPSVWQ